MPDALVQFTDVHKEYLLGGTLVRALRGVNLALGRGSYTAIMGPSGSGKSTLLNILGCLDRPTRGSYALGGIDVSTRTDDELSDIRGRHVGFIFQAYNLIPQLTLRDNIEVPLFYLGWGSRRRRTRAEELAGLVGLSERLRHRPSQLSGGQQQRAGIARALATDPLILLADEPTGNLDSATESEILDLLDQLHGQGKTIIVVTHDQEVGSRAERIVRLHDGQVVSDAYAASRADGGG